MCVRTAFCHRLYHVGIWREKKWERTKTKREKRTALRCFWQRFEICLFLESEKFLEQIISPNNVFMVVNTTDKETKQVINLQKSNFLWQGEKRREIYHNNRRKYFWNERRDDINWSKGQIRSPRRHSLTEIMGCAASSPFKEYYLGLERKKRCQCPVSYTHLTLPTKLIV